ncbi:MAG: PSD1 and planctomycete cytochrome C domain-containing protein, partial [Saprospiraceae bacterium]
PNASSREADLRLHLETRAKAVLDNGKRPIHAGNWSESEIMRRVTSDDPDIQMPPPEMNKRLTKREMALLEKWMEQGAAWKEYWAFIPPKLPEDKTFNSLSTTSQKIDYLVNKTLTANNISPSKKADKSALARRLSYLLTGLPPTPELIQQLATSNQQPATSNQSPAYEKLVDDYLASPHFGERWARHWMDLVRYAEYKGHEFDYPVIGAWQYRDYLIRAFNADVPYNQFIKEQLAGDLLENPRIHPENGTNESIHGTQIFTFSESKHSPVSIKQEEADVFDNMIDVTTKTFQGLTVACARCHDHKFDAIPTTDYYSLYGIFESTRFALIPSGASLEVFAKVDSIETIKRKMRELIAGREYSASRTLSSGSTPTTKATKKLIKLPVSNRATIIADFRDGTLNNWTSNGLAFNNKNALGEPIFDKKGQFVKLAKAKVSSRMLGTGIQGAVRSPTFIIDKEKLLVRAAGEGAMIRLIVDNFQLIQNPIYGSLEKEVHEGEMKEYVLDLKMVQGEKAYIELLPGKKTGKGGKGHYYEFEKTAWIAAEYALLFDGKTTPTAPPLARFSFKNKTIAYQNWLNGTANPAEIAAINQDLKNGKWRQNKLVLHQLNQQVNLLAQSLYDSTFFQGVTEGDAQFSPVFIRGNRTTLSEEKVPHQFFDALKDYSPEFPIKGSGRKELAEGIANPKNPLTARVMVNRVWHHLFGKGIVETVDNFGLQGKIPTHPELLDFLAVQFIEEDWSIKKLIKNIVLTEAFQRSTIPTNSAVKKDPQNLYLAHFPVRRLEAEAIRDGLLAVSGRLDKTLYGEPFEIYLTDFIKGRGRPRKSGALDGEGRRSIYQTIRRNFLPPFMLTFDMPAPFSAFGKRNTSNVPAQSLTMMNDPLVQQQAKVWATRILEKNDSFEDRIKSV